jgi:aminopeptidase
MPVPAWAAKVFPDETPGARMERLGDVIFSLCRLDSEDPEAAWRKHIEELKKRRDYLNTKQYSSLEYTGGGTDLRVGLPRDHNWVSAEVKSESGIEFVANMPTEEVFTLPHRDEVDGTVVASKPLFHRGMVFENFRLRFEKGRAVEVRADRGEELLKKIVETDEGAARLGEVALVSESSPVARSNLLFYNPLLDENAACHLALGFAFQENLKNGARMSSEEFTAAGGNSSQVHMDFMIGSRNLDIDGVTADGHREALMRKGLWAIGDGDE